MNVGVNGEMSLLVGAYVEEIEIVRFRKSYSVTDLVEYHGDTKAGCEHGDRLEDGLEFCLYVICIIEENTDSDHRAVADHRLDIDTDGFYENVAGVYHYRRSRKYRKRGEERAKEAVELSASQTCNKTYKHRSRAELPGE